MRREGGAVPMNRIFSILPVWILTSAIAFLHAAASLASPTEIHPGTLPGGNLMMGFRCEYPDWDQMSWILAVQTSEKLKLPTPLDWNVFDSQSGKYLLQWKRLETRRSNDSGTVIAVQASTEAEVRAVLLNLKSTEVHFSTEPGSRKAREIAYTFPLGRYRAEHADYFYDKTKPVLHCQVTDFDLP